MRRYVDFRLESVSVWSATSLLSLLVVMMVVISASAEQKTAEQRKAEQRRRARQQQNYAAIRERQQQAAIQAAQSQKNAAQQVLKAAEATGEGAQAKLDAALAKLRNEADQLRDAESTTRQAAKELAEIEAEILEEQEAGSPYQTAFQAMETVRRSLTEMENRILAEPKSQSQLPGLTGSKMVDGKKAILDLRSEYLVIKAEFTIKASVVAKIRTELFQADAHWKGASDALAEARREEQAAENDTRGASSGRVGLNLKARNATEAAAAARAAIAHADAVIKANSRDRNDPPGNKKNPPPKGKPQNKK